MQPFDIAQLFADDDDGKVQSVLQAGNHLLTLLSEELDEEKTELKRGGSTPGRNYASRDRIQGHQRLYHLVFLEMRFQSPLDF